MMGFESTILNSWNFATTNFLQPASSPSELFCHENLTRSLKLITTRNDNKPRPVLQTRLKRSQKPEKPSLSLSYKEVVDCRIFGDPNFVLRFAFIEFTNEVLPSKTAIAPINPTFFPMTEDEREMCARTIYCSNIDKKVTQSDVKIFFESFSGEVLLITGFYHHRLLGDYQHYTGIAFIEFVMVENEIAALNCSGVVLSSLPIRTCKKMFVCIFGLLFSDCNSGI
ncbi:hypothetical protein N665_0019s0052 [Sinapis alba]|nr:hypothetical protein N665_0019s0052 [Sinapis alba]